MDVNPKLLVIAHALGAEMDGQTYSHYHPSKGEQELRRVLVDGDLDLIALAQVAIDAVAKT